MSKEINNRQYRQQVIRSLLEQLHAGKTAEEVKAQFEEAFEGVSAAEISEAEQALIEGGMDVSEVQRLCDVHAAVFKGSIEDIHRPEDPSRVAGHPAHTLKRENRAIERLIEEKIRPAYQALREGREGARDALAKGLDALRGIETHYARKENLLFPYMEKYGITAPPKVMWGVDDEIRALIKRAQATLSDTLADPRALSPILEEALGKITEMIFKEEQILLPMLLETLTEAEWALIASESYGLGFTLIDPPPAWQARREAAAGASQAPSESLQSGAVRLPSGVLTVAQLTGLLNTLPIDITFVDAEDIVRYYSEGGERVFPRTRAIIGRKVIHCHPPGSMHIVQQILDDFRSGKKDHEDFWIKMAGKYVFIRYFAVRGEDGAYMGTLEVTQNIAPIQEISGEKRLVEG